MPVENNKTAVLFIEYQNEFTSQGGKLHEQSRLAWLRTTLRNRRAHERCSRQGRQNISRTHLFKADASDNPNKNLGILAGCAADSLFTENTWNSDFHPSMQPGSSDVVVQGKKGLDAFPGTDLEAQLLAHGIHTLALGGFLTNCCVESTMRTAYEKGFNVITLTDATATTSAEGQAVTECSYGMFSTPMTVDEFTAQISVAPIVEGLPASRGGGRRSQSTARS